MLIKLELGRQTVNETALNALLKIENEYLQFFLQTDAYFHLRNVARTRQYSHTYDRAKYTSIKWLNIVNNLSITFLVRM